MPFLKRNLWILLTLFLTKAVAQPYSYLSVSFHLYDSQGKAISTGDWRGFYSNSRQKNFDGTTARRSLDEALDDNPSTTGPGWLHYGLKAVNEDVVLDIQYKHQTMTVKLIGSGAGGCFEIDSLIFTPGKFALVNKPPCLKLWKIDTNQARVDYYNSLLDDLKTYRNSLFRNDILIELSELKKSYRIQYSDTTRKKIDDIKLPGPPY